MKSKSAKTIKPTPEYDSERETRVILERVESNISLLAEGHGTLNRKLDGLSNRLDNVESELGTIKIAAIENRNDIRTLKVGQGEIKNKLDTVINNTLANHEQRLLRLESA